MPYDHELTPDEKKELLRIARATLKEFLVSGRIPPGKPHRRCLVEPAAVFVSLFEGAELRGCIGTTEETTPLYRAIQEMAIAAATRDPRFDPVRIEDVSDLSIEISVLGARRRVTAPEQVAIGEHGVSVSGHGRRGLLLPRVAADAGWDARTFLQKTCEKAGLPPDAWSDGETVIEVFTSQTFSESDG